VAISLKIPNPPTPESKIPIGFITHSLYYVTSII